MSPSQSRSKALSLYRRIYCAASGFPTSSRQRFVRDRLKVAYEEARDETDSRKIEDCFRAEIQLETIRVQSKHLTEVFKDERVHARF